MITHHPNSMIGGCYGAEGGSQFASLAIDHQSSPMPDIRSATFTNGFVRGRVSTASRRHLAAKPTTSSQGRSAARMGTFRNSTG